MKTKLLTICVIFMSVCIVPSASLLAQVSSGGNSGNRGNSGNSNNGGNNNSGEDSDNGEEDGIKGFWEVELEGGRFLARLNTITSISQHQYVVDAAARVYEVSPRFRTFGG